MSNAVVLCADDYALTAPISQAILALAENGRISATSCMTTSPYWPEHGRWLAPLKDRIDIGLHLTLVDERPLTAMPCTAPQGQLPAIGQLIARAYAGRLALDEVSREIAAQVEAFIAVMGQAPAHIDGHLHAHVLPGIREAVLAVARELTPKPWLRNVNDRLSRILGRGVAVPKATFIAQLGRPFARAAAARGLPLNDSFSGVYGFSDSPPDYARLFERFIAARPGTGRHVILCHPGGANDPAAAWPMARGAEFDFLSGKDFPAALARHGLRLARFTAI